MMHNSTLHHCIQKCWECRNECQTTLYTYCLKEGGAQLAQEHIKVMSDCIQMCQTAADFMTRHSQYHTQICTACAVVCEACAISCERMSDDPVMKRCAKICRECAESCRSM